MISNTNKCKVSPVPLAFCFIPWMQHRVFFSKPENSMDRFTVTLLESKTRKPIFACARNHVKCTAFPAFPFAAVVGNSLAKLAMLSVVVNPEIKGVIISGRKGTGKTVLARGIHELTRELSSLFDSKISDRHSQTVPFVNLPISVTEDRLLGSVDIEQSVVTGNKVFLRGALADANNGFLQIDDINLFEDTTIDVILDVLSNESVNVEREGISFRSPCHCLPIAAFNPDEGPVRAHLQDRFGILLSLDAEELSVSDRVLATQRVLDYQDNPNTVAEKFRPQTEALRRQVMIARNVLPQVNLSHTQLLKVACASNAHQIEGQRSDIYAFQAARALAALRIAKSDHWEQNNTRYVPSQYEIDQAIILTMLLRKVPGQISEENELRREQCKNDNTSRYESEKEFQPQENHDRGDDSTQTDGAIKNKSFQDFMLSPENVVIDPRLLEFAAKMHTRQKPGRKGAKVFSEVRGRYMRADFPKAGQKVKRIAVDATLRAAAPQQKIRNRLCELGLRKKGLKQKTNILLEKSDFRSKRLVRNASALILFVVDASGSMAMNRISAAKGAAQRLLLDAYKSRNKVALISFHHERAEVLLPPTKSYTLADRRLSGMLCGGGSPLADALLLALKVSTNAQKCKNAGLVIIVLVSDGRANVPLRISQATGEAEALESHLTTETSNRELAKKDAINVARIMRDVSNIRVLCIDTENRYNHRGIINEIANFCNGVYYEMPAASMTEESIRRKL